MLRDFLAWLVDWIWKREKATSATITIDGIPFPVADFEGAVLTLHDGIKSGKSPGEIAAALGPAALPIVETFANYLFPGAGTGIELISFVVNNSIPFWKLSQAEQNRIQNQQSEDHG